MVFIEWCRLGVFCSLIILNKYLGLLIKPVNSTNELVILMLTLLFH